MTDYAHEAGLHDRAGKKPDEGDCRTVENDFIPYLKKMLGKIKFMDEVVALYLLFTDPAYPLVKKGICVGALLYFIMPFDIVPDFIPILGLLDDAAVIFAATRMYSEDIGPYKERAKVWLKEHGFTEEENTVL